MSLLHSLIKATTGSKKRLGRGYGSGKGGHTASRGQKGQKSRTGSKVPLWFEGGQLPLIKRLPMIRGKGKFKVVRPTAEISLHDIQAMTATTISLDTLKVEKIIDKKFKKAKIIGTGTISRAVTIAGILVTPKAKELIQTAGGKVE